MNIRAALKLPLREAKYVPSREGLSAAQKLMEMDRWYNGWPLDPDMDWQVRSVRMSETGRRFSGPWSCLSCKGEAVYEDTDDKDHYRHECPNWSKLRRQTQAEREQVHDDYERYRERNKYRYW